MYPFQDICIDESKMVWKGRLGFKQYIPSKRHCFGVKFFMVVDVKTRYLMDFIIFTGSGSGIKSMENMGKGGTVVM